MKIIVGNYAAVDTMPKCIAFAYPGKLRRLDSFNVIVRNCLNENKVALVGEGGLGMSLLTRDSSAEHLELGHSPKSS